MVPRRPPSPSSQRTIQSMVRNTVVPVPEAHALVLDLHIAVQGLATARRASLAPTQGVAAPENDGPSVFGNVPPTTRPILRTKRSCFISILPAPPPVVNAAGRGETGIVAPAGHFHYHAGTRRENEASPRATRHVWRPTRRDRATCDQMAFRRSDAMDM